jgi:hypothetical protein
MLLIVLAVQPVLYYRRDTPGSCSRRIADRDCQDLDAIDG